MDGYKHGAYGKQMPVSDKSTVKSKLVPIYVGTAPTHTIAGGATNLNKPVLVSSFAGAAKRLGYSEDWASYTLCEAMYVHFNLKGVGPLIFIPVLDAQKCKAGDTPTPVSATPANGRVVISNAERIILDSVAVTGKTPGVDYTIQYDYKTKRIQIAQIRIGSLGTEPLTVTYDTVDVSKVTAEDIIGLTDGEGQNTGIHAVLDVYQRTGCIPSQVLCPGYSDIPEVHDAMADISIKANGHWDMSIYTDIPILGAGNTQMTMAGAVTWKAANGYTRENEKTFFPMIRGKDGRLYHLSVLACANKQKLDVAAAGVPYQSASNTEIAITESLYFGEDASNLCIDDQVVNEKLCQHGITSAAFVGGRWVIWGPHAAAYIYQADEDDGALPESLFDTNLMMVQYLTNDFQHRRALDIDKPLSMNRLQQIACEEQARLDSLVSAYKLTNARVYLMASEDDQSDMAKGDYKFAFEVQTTKLAKSLTAYVYLMSELSNSANGGSD